MRAARRAISAHMRWCCSTHTTPVLCSGWLLAAASFCAAPGRARRPQNGQSVRAMRSNLAKRSAALIRAIRDGDERMVEDEVRALSQSRRIFAPLAFAVGAFVMLFDGVKLLVFNLRLTLVQLLPAMWIWIAVFDLRVHALRDKAFHVPRGPVLIPMILLIVAITAASLPGTTSVLRRDSCPGVSLMPLRSTLAGCGRASSRSRRR
jgi:hypothetical protein